MAKMLILRGITIKPKYPRGALDEPSAIEYARRLGYEPFVLDVSGETGVKSEQTRMAVKYIRADPTINAIYGFSGGGYNVRHIIGQLTKEERARIAKVIVIGAPNQPESAFRGPWQLIYRGDPKTGHMDGPRSLLAELGPPPEE